MITPTMSGLCGNGDCGAVLDQPGIRFRDRWERREVDLCPLCAVYVERVRDARYERLLPTERSSECP